MERRYDQNLQLSVVLETSTDDVEAIFQDYSQRLGDQNPFLPLQEGLKPPLDQSKVCDSFKQACLIYQKITRLPSHQFEVARLYKLGGVGEASKACKKIFQSKRADFHKMTIEEIKIEINKMCMDEDIDMQIVGRSFSREQTNIEKAYSQPAPNVRQAQLNPIYERIFKKGIEKEIACAFFKTDKEKKDLENICAVYKPQGFHSWGANLAWILGHLKRGNSFIVCSDILSNQYRRGYQAERIPCAFARELCAALKAGYILRKTEAGITLAPRDLQLEQVQSPDSSGVLGDGVNPTYAEVDQVYQQLEQAHWDEKKNFECRFEFQAGVVQMQILNQSEAQFETPSEAGRNLSVEMSRVFDSMTSLSRNLAQGAGTVGLTAQFNEEFSSPSITKAAVSATKEEQTSDTSGNPSQIRKPGQ